MMGEIWRKVETTIMDTFADTFHPRNPGHGLSRRQVDGHQHYWLVQDLWEATVGVVTLDLRVEDVLATFHPRHWLHGVHGWSDLTNIHPFFDHDRARRADLAFPIVLAPDGTVMDGEHRLAKCICDGLLVISTKALPVWLPPRYIDGRLTAGMVPDPPLDHATEMTHMAVMGR